MRIDRRFLTGLLVGACSWACVSSLGPFAADPPKEKSNSDRPDNAELAELYDKDQADRMPAPGKPIDWSIVGPRDRQREARVKALYEAGNIHTGKDYHRAAMVLQHAAKPEDYLLAHEFCVAAVSKGERAASWLACASEDRFLMSIDRPQRFGTQYRSLKSDSPVTLYRIEPGVTDTLRRELGVPTLGEARKREAMMNDLIQGKKGSR